MTKRVYWISALIPTKGAELYDGVRLALSTSGDKCYEDLGEWLTEMTDWEYQADEHGVADDFDLERATVDDIVDALDDAVDQNYIKCWKVEAREIKL